MGLEVLLVCCSALIATPFFLRPADAFSAFNDKIPNGCGVPDPCNISDVWCAVGYRDVNGGGALDPFGRDFAAHGYVWNTTICHRDSDGDGLTNGQELGDPNCTWTEGSSPGCNCTSVNCICGASIAGISHPGICQPLASPTCLRKNYWLNCASHLKCPAMNESGVQVLSLKVLPTRMHLPRHPQPTMSFCHLVQLPNDTKYHMIASTALLRRQGMVQYIAVYGCTDLPLRPVSSKPVICPKLLPCVQIITIYAPSVALDCLPSEYGIPIGAGNGFKYAYIMVHYTNLMKTGYLVDSSEIQLYLVSRLRPNDGGLMTTGQMHIEIPPKQQQVVQTGYCTTDCHRPVTAVNLTRFYASMHLLGRSYSVSQYRNGQLLKQLVINESYMYYSPSYHFLEPYIEYQPGDELRVDCSYDSTSRDCNTYYGENIDQEMCFLSASYYPLQQDWDFCLQDDNISICDTGVLVPGCNMSTLNDTLSSLEYCNFTFTNACSVPCFNNVVRQVANTGCMTPDVRLLITQALRAMGQDVAAKVVDLVWSCGGYPPAKPPSGCLATSQTPKHLITTTPHK